MELKARPRHAPSHPPAPRPGIHYMELKEHRRVFLSPVASLLNPLHGVERTSTSTTTRWSTPKNPLHGVESYHGLGVVSGGKRANPLHGVERLQGALQEEGRAGARRIHYMELKD